jgi:formylglycine-generating enzyme required for sulfatase activity
MRALLITIFIAGLAGCAQPQGPTPLTIVENSIGMKLVRIPAGEFQMGSNETVDTLLADFPTYIRDHLAAPDDEQPIHRIRISKPFFLGQFEVTVDQFNTFVRQSGYTPESIGDGTGAYGFNAHYDPSKTERQDAFEGRDPKYSWRNPGFVQRGDEPVVNVTWKDAVALADWLSRKEKARYRLPTEAEWEYACQAGSATRHMGGNKPAALAEYANIMAQDTTKNWPQYSDRAAQYSDGFAFTSPVGSFKPNAFGLYDMLGNVWEWASDWHAPDYYSRSPTEDPTGPQSGEVKVRRGASWHTLPIYARCAFRNWNTPETRYTLVGIRLVKEIE